MDEKEISAKVAQGQMRCRIIIELMGAPKEHVEDTLRLVLQRLKDEAAVSVISGTVHKPKEQDKLFASFAELDVLFKDFLVLTRICFDYMPSSIEVVEPSSFKLPAVELSGFLTDMLASLHAVDFRLKDANAANQLLERNSANLLKNFILTILSGGGKSVSDISEVMGIKAGQLEPFIALFSREGLIRKNGSLWEKA